MTMEQAMAGRRKRQFTFRASIAQEPMPVEEWHAVERLLARLIAKAYLADNPHLLTPRSKPEEQGGPGDDDRQS